MKELFEIGIVFRGFVLVHYDFKPLPKQDPYKAGVTRDLRGAFVSAINSFVETAFKNSFLEYLESGEILFIFKITTIKSSDSPDKEPIILYGIVKRKKKADKLVQKFMEKIEPLLLLFVQKYEGKDFCELSQFEKFEENVKAYFEL